MTELDQLEAIEAVLAGDLAAFDQLVAHLEPSVLRVAHGISNDADRAHDIAQDAFVAAYRQLTQYDSHRAKFSTWLLTITKNLAIKSNRKNGRLNSMTTSESHEPTESAPPPSEALQWRETFSALDRALIQLPAKWRTAFVLTELESRSYEEAAQIEAVPVGTIRSRVYRARQRLKKAIETTSVKP